MKKLLIIISLNMVVNSLSAQVSVDDDLFPTFVAAQNAVNREEDSLKNLSLMKKIDKLDSMKVISTTVKVSDNSKNKLTVVKKTQQQKVQKPTKTSNVESKQTLPTTETNNISKVLIPLNNYFYEENYQLAGLSIFSELKLVGLKFECTLREKDYILFKLVKKDIAIDGLQRTKQSFTGSYFIPILWWNENNRTGSLTYEQLEYIKNNFSIKYKD